MTDCCAPRPFEVKKQKNKTKHTHKKNTNAYQSQSMSIIKGDSLWKSKIGITYFLKAYVDFFIKHVSKNLSETKLGKNDIFFKFAFPTSQWKKYLFTTPRKSRLSDRQRERASCDSVSSFTEARTAHWPSE